MNTTYWGRDWGVLIIKDIQTGMELWKKFVKNVRLADYRKRVEYIELQGYIVRGIVCDGLKSMFQLFALYEGSNVPISSSRNYTTLYIH